MVMWEWICTSQKKNCKEDIAAINQLLKTEDYKGQVIQVKEQVR
jgi:hypothetical protein